MSLSQLMKSRMTASRGLCVYIENEKIAGRQRSKPGEVEIIMNNRGWLSWSQAQSMVPKIASSIDWLAMNGQVATQRRGRVDWFRQAAVYQVTEKAPPG